mgnify:CR=1 FL=1|tara:strand:+ start:1148 stop:1798 length:651 start_codon:yes stop_codon:yes gene_type:complete
MTNYVIVNPARCGSTWLVCGLEHKYKLNNFNDCFGKGTGDVRIAGEKINLKNYTESEKLFIVTRNTPYIVKIFTDSMMDLVHFEDNNTRFIWLYRKSLAEHFLSFYFARKTEIFNLHENPWDFLPSPSPYNIEKEANYQTPDFNPTEDDKNFYLDILEKQERAYEKYQHMFNVEIAYEDLFENNPWDITLSSTLKLNTYKQEWIDWAEKNINEWRK